MKVSKADFNSIALYMEIEQVTIPHCTMESYANTIQPRNVTTTTIVMPTPTVIKPRNVTCTTMVMATPAINFVCADPKVNVIDAADVKIVNALDFNVTDNLDIKAVNSPLIKQPLLEPPTYDFAPVEQQDTLHDFFHYVSQGTFGIPGGGKIYCPLPGIDPVAWP